MNPQKRKLGTGNPEFKHSQKGTKKKKKKGKKGKEKLSVFTKRMVAASQLWRCADCTCCLPAGYSIDHLIALFLGGTNALSNLRALCPECHALKTTFENSVQADLLAKRKDHLQRTLEEYTAIYERLKERRRQTVLRIRAELGSALDFPGKLRPDEKPWRSLPSLSSPLSPSSQKLPVREILIPSRAEKLAPDQRACRTATTCMPAPPPPL